jgi:molybdate/tungstate transport system substrate-binding protein
MIVFIRNGEYTMFRDEFKDLTTVMFIRTHPLTCGLLSISISYRVIETVTLNQLGGNSLKMSLIAVMALAAMILGACAGEGERSGPRQLVIFHAGSLSVPFRQISDEFEREHPGVRVLLESAGSRACARKIKDLGRECDVMASADYTVIDELLIPEHADWNIHFAANEMAIVFHDGSIGAEEINADSWHQLLLRDDVAFGRSDPDSDPCGYRAVLVMKLAERHYQVDGLSGRLIEKDKEYIRPKETDLLALLETGTIDYIFLYRSVAEQHGLDYILLPDEINLKSTRFAEEYDEVSVEISGKKPGTSITKRGAPMVYGVTIPKNAPNPELALEFVRFLLEKEKGLAIMERNGQPSLVPSPTDTYDRLPGELRRFALPPESGNH